jgi:hypothetical protein
VRFSPRTMRVAIAAVAGAGVGVADVTLWAGGSAASHAVLRQPRLSLEENKRPLSRREFALLLAWAGRYRTCAVGRGVALARPRLGVNEITMAPPTHVSIGLLLRKLLACDQPVGLPPPGTALTVAREDRQIHLYRPKVCALPPKESA